MTGHRIAIVQGEGARKVVLTELRPADDARPQLQVTLWCPDASSSPGAFARLTVEQARRLELELHAWLNGREDAA